MRGEKQQEEPTAQGVHHNRARISGLLLVSRLPFHRQSVKDGSDSRSIELAQVKEERHRSYMYTVNLVMGSIS